MDSINLKRRKICQSFASLSGLPILSPFSTALLAENSSTFNLSGLHQQAAEAARKLNQNSSSHLKLLLPNGSVANVKPAIDEFTRLTDIRFELIETPVDDINTRMFLESRLSDGTYDIALPATFGIPDLAEAGAIAELDEYAARYQPLDFQENALYTIGDYYRGKLYGYQTDGDAYLMFYNRRFLENEMHQKNFSELHGYQLKVPETWQQLDAMMAYFHQPDKGAYGGSLFRIPGYMLWEWWIRFHAKGFYPLADNLEPQINNQAGIEALEELIAATDHLSPNARTNGLFDNWREFSQGNIFCNIGWGGTQKYLNSNKSAIRGDLEFGPTPGGIVNGKLIKASYFNWGWNYTVAKNSAEQEMAYLFILFACSPVISTLSVREPAGFFDPFRQEHYSDKLIIDTYSKAFMDEHYSSMLNSIPDLYLNGQTLYYDTLREQIKLASDGKISATKALNDAAKAWKKLHFKLGRKTQAEQWRFLKKKYPESIRSLLI